MVDVNGIEEEGQSELEACFDGTSKSIYGD